MDDRPRLSGRRVAGLTGALTAVLTAVRVGWVEPWLRAPGTRVNGRLVAEVKPEGLAALPLALCLALGLAVLIGLAVANRKCWRAVLRPNAGRVIGALSLVFMTPLAVFDWLPFFFSGIAIGTVLALSVQGQLLGALMWLAALLVAFALWYPVACLIVSGIHNRALRVAVFFLMFWAAYSAIILAVGAGPRFTL